MEFTATPGSCWITFDVRANDSATMDGLSFIHLMRMKFDAEEQSVGRYKNDEGKFIFVRLQFRDFSTFDEAKSHCNRHLDEQGRIKLDYIGALDRNDPRRLAASAIKSRAMKTTPL